VKVEDKKQSPPKLHDLPSLQKLCSSRFGWSAAKTLEVAQELYDGQGKKIITYPRAEVRYLPESLIADVPMIVAGLQVGQSFKSILVPAPPIIRRGASGPFHDRGLDGASHHAVIPNVNTVDSLREVWPRLSLDEKKLFDVIARAYLASLMPDFRYRQTTATLDVKDFPFKATGRQPIDLGWRAAFPEWQPADEKGDGGQLLPAMRDGETAQLHDPTVETKETKPPSRYSEGTLIEAMQNAWRFVDDEVLRDRLKEAKGIGTPATRAEIIGGLKKQDFLVAQGKNVVPTETGLKLFGVLKQADPALVDPGVTAQLECLLDDVVVGKQGMVGAIDAVCDVALRIIGKLTQGAASGGPPLLGPARGGSGGERPPTPAMKQFAVALARQKGVRLPAGYGTSGSICRAFLEQHAPKKARGETSAAPASGATSPTQASGTEGTQPARKRRQAKGATAPTPSPKKAARAKRPRKPAFGNPPVKAPGLHLRDVGRNTPLRIPYGNKEVAKKLGALYGAHGWYAPPGVDLSAFKENGWL
jgi:DNA topoisomerase-3